MERNGKRIILVIGGSRSGKSRHALQLSETFSRRAFIATALPIDDEMKKRINTHKKERNNSFLTIEEPYKLGSTIKNLSRETDVAIIDCLTVWLGNLIYKYRDPLSQMDEIEAFFSALKDPPCSLILVSNEVGLGIIPADPSTRRFRDLAGSLNQRTAAMADEVVFTIAGIPLHIKG